MDRKGIFNDLKLLLKDVSEQGHSTIVHEEQNTTVSGAPVKTTYVLRGKTGLDHFDNFDKKPER